MRYAPWQRAVLLLFPVVIALAVVLQHLHPGSYALAQLVGGTVIPVAGLGFVVADQAFKRYSRNRELDTLRRKFLEQAGKNRSPVVLPTQPPRTPQQHLMSWDERIARFRQVIAELDSGRLTRDEARSKWQEARRLVSDPALAPRNRPVAPEKQLEQLSAQYGLPVTTPLQKPEPLPLMIAPPASASGMSSMAQWAEGLKSLQPAVAASDPVPDDLSSYAPAGQGELSRDLYEYMTGQVKADVEAHGKKTVRSRRWHMSPEWMRETEKLKDTTGGPLLLARHRTEKWQSAGTVFGYKVTVGDAFGVPELREP